MLDENMSLEDIAKDITGDINLEVVEENSDDAFVTYIEEELAETDVEVEEVFEDDLYDRLSKVYFNGIPVSIQIKYLNPFLEACIHQHYQQLRLHVILDQRIPFPLELLQPYRQE